MMQLYIGLANSLAVILWITVQLIQTVNSTSSLMSQKFKETKDSFQNFAPKFSCRSEIMCAYECAFDNTCKGSSFQQVTKQCRRMIQKTTCDSNTNVKTSQQCMGNNTMNKCENAPKMKKVCDDGWEEIFDSCYYFGKTTKTWTNAEKDCVTRGSHLITVDSACEEQLILSYLMGKTSNWNFWVGANDIDREGTWKWISNKASLTYNNWRPGQPNNSGGRENCAVIYWPKQYEWDDDDCRRQFFYVCEK